MTSNYSPWDQGALSFDLNPQLMSIPGLMMDPSFSTAPSSIPPVPEPQYPVSSPQPVYQPPITPQPIKSSIHQRMPQTPPAPSSRPSEGPQIRLNPLVMKPNLNRSFPISTSLKRWVYFNSLFLSWFSSTLHWVQDWYYSPFGLFHAARRTTKRTFKTRISNQSTGSLTNTIVNKPRSVLYATWKYPGERRPL